MAAAAAAKRIMKIVAVSGTSRPNNFTSMALAVTVNDLRRAGIQVTVFDAREMKLDFPGSAPTPDSLAMTSAIAECEGVLIATPEYHVSL
jgi:NAD(P)H-dependent FMN reductase